MLNVMHIILALDVLGKAKQQKIESKIELLCNQSLNLLSLQSQFKKKVVVIDTAMQVLHKCGKKYHTKLKDNN